MNESTNIPYPSFVTTITGVCTETTRQQVATHVHAVVTVEVLVVRREESPHHVLSLSAPPLYQEPFEGRPWTSLQSHVHLLSAFDLSDGGCDGEWRR